MKHTIEELIRHCEEHATTSDLISRYAGKKQSKFYQNQTELYLDCIEALKSVPEKSYLENLEELTKEAKLLKTNKSMLVDKAANIGKKVFYSDKESYYLQGIMDGIDLVIAILEREMFYEEN